MYTEEKPMVTFRDSHYSQGFVFGLEIRIWIRDSYLGLSKVLGLGQGRNPLYICYARGYTQVKRAWPRVSLPCT